MAMRHVTWVPPTRSLLRELDMDVFYEAARMIITQEMVFVRSNSGGIWSSILPRMIGAEW